MSASIFTIALLGVVTSTFFLTISDPKFNQISKFTLNSVKSGVLNTDIQFSVINENPFSIRGKQLSAELYYGERLFGKGQNMERFVLAKKSESTVAMNFDFYLDSLEDDLENIFLRDTVVFDVKVSGLFTSFNIKREDEFAVRVSGRELMEKMIGNNCLIVDNIQIGELGIKETKLLLDLQVTNCIPENMFVRKIEASVFSDESLKYKVADWTDHPEIELNNGKSEVIKGEVVIDNKNLAISGITKVISGKLEFWIDGHILLETKEILFMMPLQQRFKYNILTQKVEIVH